MNDNFSPSPSQTAFSPTPWADRAVALGAGLASALLFASSAQGGALALFLTYFSPLPLLIGAAGFSALGALAGALAGAALLAGAASPALGAAFLAGFAAPSLALGFLVNFRRARAEGEPALLLSPGALLSVCAAFGAGIALLGLGVLIAHFGGFDPAIAQLSEELAPAIDPALENMGALAEKIDAATLRQWVAIAAPAGVAASQTLLLALNLWAAARTIEISGRLRRPWMNLPEFLALPRAFALVVVVAAALISRGGALGAGAGAIFAAGALALALQGLAALHGLTRGVSGRAFWLAGLYAAIMVLEPWSIAFLAVFGVVESAFALRARKARASLSKPEKN